LNDPLDTLKKMQQLLAENQSLKQQLLECNNIISAKNTEIELLQQMLTEATERQSELDIQMEELELLKHRIGQLTNLSNKAGY
jgi:chromosome segregation ATPase